MSTSASQSFALTSTSELIGLANANNTEAQYVLGLRYFSGEGAEKNYQEALKFWTQAATSGHGFAQNNLGVMYASGEGVPQSDATAFQWFRSSAEQGNHIGQLNLGRAFAEGKGVPADMKQAAVWISKSAAQGNVEAAQMLQHAGHSVNTAHNSSSLSGKQSIALLLTIVSILPWSVYFINSLGPSLQHFFGLTRVPLGGLIFFCIAPQAFILWLILGR